MDCHVLTAVATALASTGLNGGSQPALPGFLNSLSSPLEHYGLWAVLVLVLVEDFGIPVPGETVLIAGAVFAGSGRLNIVAVGVVGFVAAVVGDNIGYAIGRFGGRALVDRWGKYVFLTPERLDKAETFFDHQGAKIITIARFIEGLRQANGIIAGITDMHWLRFVAYNALGAALWVGTWVSVGYFAGQHITTIYNTVTRYSLYAAIAAVVLIAAWVLHRLRKRRRSLATAVQQMDARRETAAEPAAAGQSGPAAPPETTAAPAETAAQPADTAHHETARPETAAPPVAAAQPETATREQAGAGQAEAAASGGHDGNGRGERRGVAAGEDDGQGRADRQGQGLTGAQDSERS